MRAVWKVRRALRVAAVTGAAAFLVGAEEGCTHTVLDFYVALLVTSQSGTFHDGHALSITDGPLDGAPGVNRAAARLEVPGAAAGAEFGAAVAIGDRSPDHVLVVGAPADAPGGVATGAAYSYNRSVDGAPWGERAQLRPPAGTPAGARFGESVAMTRTLLVVGAPGYAPYGAAFVFERSGASWVFAEQLAPHELASGGRFGAAVAILPGDDPLILVGVPDELRGGRVDVFRESATGAWGPDDGNGNAPSLRAADVVSVSRFGASLAALGDHLAVGSPGAFVYFEDTHVQYLEAGAAYVYQYDRATSRWGTPTGLGDPDPLTGGRFGTAVAFGAYEDGVTAAYLAVGAPGQAGGPALSGRVHVYDRNQAIWDRAHGALGDPGNGTSVALTDIDENVAGRFAVGAGGPVAGAAGDPSGRGGLWERFHGTYLGVDVLGGAVTDPPSADSFGSAIAMKHIGNPYRVLVLVGAPRAGTSGAVDEFVYAAGNGTKKAPAGRGEPAPVVDRYLAFEADDDATSAASASLSLGRPLRAPFRVEISVGSFDAAKRAGLTGGSLRFELAGLASAAGKRATLRAQFAADGLGVSAGSETGAAGTTADLAGTWIADLAAAYDGATLRLETRPRGSGPFTEVASIPVAGAEFTPSIVIDGIGAGAEVGIDEPRVVANGPPSPGATPEETIVDRVYAAMDRQFEATSSLDAGAAAEVTRPMLDAAGAELRAAVGALDALLAPPAKKPATGPRTARRVLRTALRELAAAGAKLAKNRPRAAVDKRLEKVFAAESRAIAALTQGQP